MIFLITIRILLLSFCFLFLAFPTYAHKPSDSYITLKKDEKNSSIIQAQWDIALRDLDYAIGLDDNNDGLITWGEVRKHHKDIENYVLPLFKMKVDNKYCKNNIIEHLIDTHTDGAYDAVRFYIKCPSSITRPREFDLIYNLFFDLDPQHRGLLNIQHKDKTITAIFSPEKMIQHFNLNSLNLWHQFIEFIKEGIWHIWIGFDHILFLLALLLGAILMVHRKEQQGVSSFKNVFWNVFKIVTAFTVAHSITLAIAAFKILDFPSRLIESLIAASVIMAALNNIFPVFKEGRWLIAFIFGLIHGFGFANVLMDLGLSNQTLAIPLFSFNIGVEIGQLVIVFCFLPIAFKLRETFLYNKIILIGGSVLITIISSIWLIERAFNLTLFSF